jgi:hypothetical protein
MTKKSLTDGRTDGQTDDSTKSIGHIFQKCALKKSRINRKFRVPRKQGAHFLGAGAQMQESWVFLFHHQHEISDR